MIARIRSFLSHYSRVVLDGFVSIGLFFRNRFGNFLRAAASLWASFGRYFSKILRWLRLDSRPGRALALILGLGGILVVAALLLNVFLNRELAPLSEMLDNEPETLEAQPVEIGVVPSFDIVRISAGGDTVMAGHGPTRTRISLFLNGQVLGSTETDDQGEWVFLTAKPLPPGEHRLNLSARSSEGRLIQGRDDVVVLVPDRVVTLEGGDSPDQPLVILLPGDSDRGSRILQRQGEKAPVGPYFTVEQASYDSFGRLSLSGQLRSDGAQLIAYLDNAVLGGTQTEGKGAVLEEWTMRVARHVSPGSYNLRVDMLIKDKVVLRRVLPLILGDAHGNAQGNAQGNARMHGAEANQGGYDAERSLFRVSRGDNLWRIARQTLGRGTLYVVIYQENREQIRDPDLIFPGQVFRIPNTNAPNL